MYFYQVLISRDYRGDIDKTVIDKFLPLVLDAEDEGMSSPIVVYNKVTFVYIKHNNVYSILTRLMQCVAFYTVCMVQCTILCYYVYP